MRKLLLPILDVYDLALRALNKKTHLPPPSLRGFVGGFGHYERVADEFFGHFKTLCDLKSTDRVLDIGCGSGRMALPLSHYITTPGHYVGMDVHKKSIDWCLQNITGKHPHFNFYQADLYNKKYNPTATTFAKDYRFPFEDNSFDFVFLTSVFTHMLPADVRNFTAEINRLLSPGGRAFITFFILNEDQMSLQRDGKGNLHFKVRLNAGSATAGAPTSDTSEDFWTTDVRVPERAIAFTEKQVRSFFAEPNLAIQEPIHFGTWCGREEGLTYQDVIVAGR